MSKSLAFCLCADDYAMTPGVSRGILEAFDAGALTATSVMTTSPWWPESADALQRYAARADIGLHLNLTLGAPLGPMPALAPDGRLPDIRTLLRLNRTRTLPSKEVAEEIDRQCDRFATVFGKAPDHVDGHQHVQVLSHVRPLLLDALAKRGWRPWLRDSADKVWRLAQRGGVKKALVLSVLADGFGRMAARRNFVCNDGFAGYSPFDPGIDYADLFEGYLRAPGTRHLVMCHPGYVDDDLRRIEMVLETREQELRFLTTGLADALRRRGASLARLSAMS